MNLSMEIEAGDWNNITGLERVVRGAAQAALSKGEARSIHVLLVDDAEMRVINHQWRGIDKSTNVLAFPAGHQPLPKGEVAHLGDLVLAWETVAQEATEGNKDLNNHISHLIVHGILHLLGHDHQDDAGAEAMEAKETEILAGLGIADPYAS